jgi:hypothetical protein
MNKYITAIIMGIFFIAPVTYGAWDDIVGFNYYKILESASPPSPPEIQVLAYAVSSSDHYRLWLKGSHLS